MSASRQLAETITQWVDRIFAAYAHNGNGKVQLDPPPMGDDENILANGTASFATLFQASDANGDREVTRAELDAAICTFDDNGDGIINNATSPEHDSFISTFGTGSVL